MTYLGKPFSTTSFLKPSCKSRLRSAEFLVAGAESLDLLCRREGRKRRKQRAIIQLRESRVYGSLVIKEHLFTTSE